MGTAVIWLAKCPSQPWNFKYYPPKYCMPFTILTASTRQQQKVASYWSGNRQVTNHQNFLVPMCECIWHNNSKKGGIRISSMWMNCIWLCADVSVVEPGQCRWKWPKTASSRIIAWARVMCVCVFVCLDCAQCTASNVVKNNVCLIHSFKL